MDSTSIGRSCGAAPKRERKGTYTMPYAPSPTASVTEYDGPTWKASITDDWEGEEEKERDVGRSAAECRTEACVRAAVGELEAKTGALDQPAEIASAQLV